MKQYGLPYIYLKEALFFLYNVCMCIPYVCFSLPFQRELRVPLPPTIVYLKNKVGLLLIGVCRRCMSFLLVDDSSGRERKHTSSCRLRLSTIFVFHVSQDSAFHFITDGDLTRFEVKR
jgi:hypothetical protein